MFREGEKSRPSLICVHVVQGTIIVYPPKKNLEHTTGRGIPVSSLSAKGSLLHLSQLRGPCFISAKGPCFISLSAKGSLA